MLAAGTLPVSLDALEASLVQVGRGAAAFWGDFGPGGAQRSPGVSGLVDCFHVGQVWSEGAQKVMSWVLIILHGVQQPPVAVCI